METNGYTWAALVLLILLVLSIFTFGFRGTNDVEVPKEPNAEFCVDFVVDPNSDNCVEFFPEVAECEECIVCEEPFDYLAVSAEECLAEIVDGNHFEYDAEDCKWIKFSDEWSIDFNEDDWTAYFEGKLKCVDDLEKDVEWYDCEVEYDADDDEFEVNFDD